MDGEDNPCRRNTVFRSRSGSSKIQRRFKAPCVELEITHRCMLIMANQKTRRTQRKRSAHLPQELVMTEVLPRLPVKSLVRFKCVCKDWLALISNPQFGKAHQLRQSKPACGLICESSKPGVLSYFNLERENGGERKIDFNVEELVKDTVMVKDSCNGLILLKSKNPDLQFYICNPITQWHLKLPEFLPGDHVQHLWSSLAYDNKNQKYKVVITFKKKSGRRVFDPESYKCGVFTLGDNEGGGSWRELDMPAAYSLSSCRPLSAIGALYWLAERRYDDMIYGCILMMDLASEEFREIKSPELPASPTSSLVSVLLEMKGSLCLSYQVSHKELDLWVLDDPVKQEWKKNTIKVDSCLANSWFHLFLVLENPSPVIIFLPILKEELLFYNLDTGEFKVEHKNRIAMGNRVAHVNSLISF